KLSSDAVEVSLMPATAGNAAALQTTRTNARGFFQFKGLAAGSYSIRGAKGGSITETEPVKIREGVAAELTSPLLLDRPKRLTVTVAPRTDPAGIPWTIRLSSNEQPPRRGEVISTSRLSAAGEWTHPAL